MIGTSTAETLHENPGCCRNRVFVSFPKAFLLNSPSGLAPNYRVPGTQKAPVW